MGDSFVGGSFARLADDLSNSHAALAEFPLSKHFTRDSELRNKPGTLTLNLDDNQSLARAQLEICTFRGGATAGLTSRVSGGSAEQTEHGDFKQDRVECWNWVRYSLPRDRPIVPQIIATGHAEELGFEIEIDPKSTPRAPAGAEGGNRLERPEGHAS